MKFAFKSVNKEFSNNNKIKNMNDIMQKKEEIAQINIR